MQGDWHQEEQHLTGGSGHLGEAPQGRLGAASELAQAYFPSRGSCVSGAVGGIKQALQKGARDSYSPVLARGDRTLSGHRPIPVAHPVAHSLKPVFCVLAGLRTPTGPQPCHQAQTPGEQHPSWVPSSCSRPLASPATVHTPAHPGLQDLPSLPPQAAASTSPHPSSC